MHGDAETPGEGVPRDAGHLQLDRAGAQAAAAAARRAPVAAHGARLAQEPRARGVDARQVGLGNEVSKTTVQCTYGVLSFKARFLPKWKGEERRRDALRSCQVTIHKSREKKRIGESCA